jgi:hypothetical protein
MTASELVEPCAREPDYQIRVNAFLDEFREAPVAVRREMVAAAPERDGWAAGLVAAICDVLCRESGIELPEWAQRTGSPHPFFAFSARSYELRVRLMLESPPAFRARKVFVPQNFMTRA